MQDSMRMAILYSCTELVDKLSDLVLTQMLRFSLQVFLEIIFHIFKHKVKNFSLENDLFEFDNIRVSHCLKN